tara:strand:- start:125 stop:1183 length:1059 start_codon:yes stop_codon:yes gene_type:complete
MGKKEAMLTALQGELIMRKDEFRDEVVETIYFGGGTPSVLSIDELQMLIQTVNENYSVASNTEITLEANPDDLDPMKIKLLSDSPINRLSIGVQSFFEEDLRMMNRAHSSIEATACIESAVKYFDNISIDLIYGIPGMTLDRWKHNLAHALTFNIPHISSYALTVEPKTALANFIKKGVIKPVDDSVAQKHFHYMAHTLAAAGYVHYEISNFGKPDYFSRNNTAYWQGKKYLGIGPSAHSYDGMRRGWNIGNNPKYIRSIEQNILPMEVELLSTTDRYNEYVMTGLRTIWGVSLTTIVSEFGATYLEYLMEQAEKSLAEQLLVIDGDQLKVTKKGKFLADGIAADLFMVNLG